MEKIWSKCKEWFGKDRLPHAAVTALVVGIVVVVNVIVSVLTLTFNLYYYADYTKEVEVTDAPLSAFAEAIADKKTLTVVFCQAREDVESGTTGRYVLKTAELMQEKMPDFMKVEFQNIIVHPNLLVDIYGFTEAEAEGALLAKSSVIFIGEDYVGNKQYRVLTDTSTSAGYVDFYDYDASSQSLTAYLGEEVMTAMGLWVLTENHPKALITDFHGETVTRSLSLALTEAGYVVDTVDLRKNVDFSDVALLIISNPQTDFQEAGENAEINSEIDRLSDYLSGGGLVYLTLDPYSQAKMPVLKKLMKQYGIEQASYETEEGKTVLQIVKDRDNGISTDGFSIIGSFAEGNDTAKAARALVEQANDGQVLLAYASPLLLSAGAKPLLVSSSAAVTEADGKTVDRDGSYALVAYAEKTYGTGKVGKMIVSGSVYLTASDAMVSDSYANRDFLFALFETVGGRTDSMPYGCKPMLLSDTSLHNLTMKTARTVTVLLMAIPLCIGVAGCVVLVRRKNR